MLSKSRREEADEHPPSPVNCMRAWKCNKRKVPRDSFWNPQALFAVVCFDYICNRLMQSDTLFFW